MTTLTQHSPQVTEDEQTDLHLVLEALTVPQLRRLARAVGVNGIASATKAKLTQKLGLSRPCLSELLPSMTRDQISCVADALQIRGVKGRKAEMVAVILGELAGRRQGRLDHETDLGRYYLGDSPSVLKNAVGEDLEGTVNLILTSPPFPLNKKKKYGNLQGEEYRQWLAGLAPVFSRLLAPDGSVVIELGNAWEPGRPVQSLLHLHSLIDFVEHQDADLRLCQQFVCYNPARLPSPAQWVTVERMRVTDSFTQVWWMANRLRIHSGSGLPEGDWAKRGRSCG